MSMDEAGEAAEDRVSRLRPPSRSESLHQLSRMRGPEREALCVESMQKLVSLRARAGTHTISVECMGN